MGPADVIAVADELIYGFVCVWVHYGLAARERPEPFLYTLEALVYSQLVRISAAGVEHLAGAQGVDLSTWGLALPWALAALLGVLTAALANHDLTHRLFRALHITDRTSHPSTWHRALTLAARNQQWILLHLKDGRRLFGWPEQWPEDPRAGDYFTIAEASWEMERDDGTVERVPVRNAWQILVPAEDVGHVEILYTETASADADSEQNDGHPEAESATGTTGRAASVEAHQGLEAHPATALEAPAQEVGEEDPVEGAAAVETTLDQVWRASDSVAYRFFLEDITRGAPTRKKEAA